MSLDPLTCPYCNSPAQVPPGTQPGQRVVCRRCGESFPYRGVAVAEPLPAPAPTTSPLPAPAPRRRSNALVASGILGVMLLLALVALTFALQTVDVRRDHDAALPKSRAVAIPAIMRVLLGLYVVGLVAALLWGWNRGERAAGGRTLWQRLTVPALAVVTLVAAGSAIVMLQGRPARQGTVERETPAVARVAPAELPALGYLPPGTNAVVAVHVAEALQTPAGKDLLARLRLGDGSLETWTGLKLADLDHAALGLTLDEQILPRMTLVVRTLRPYDAERVRGALKAGRGSERGGKTLYRFAPEQFGLDAYLWCAGASTLVVARKPEDFDRIPATPVRGVDHLPEALRSVLTTRLGPSAQVWAAGHVDGWEKVGAQLLLAPLFGPDWETVRGVRTAGASLLCDDGVTLDASVRCADEAAATALRKYLTPRDGAEGKGAKALGLRPDAEPMLREFARTLKTAQEGDWVTVQAKAK